MQEVWISQNYEKFHFSLRHLTCFLKMALTLSCLSDYNFSNFPYSGLILPFVLSTMMYLVLYNFYLCALNVRSATSIQKKANFSFMKGPIWGFRVPITFSSKSRLLSQEIYFLLPYMNFVSWRNCELYWNFDPN